MEIHFDFVVSGLDEAQADYLLERIIELVSVQGGSVGGGFAPVEEVQDEQTDAE